MGKWLKELAGLIGGILLVILIALAATSCSKAEPTERRIEYYNVKCERMEEGVYKPWLAFKAYNFYAFSDGYTGKYTQENDYREFTIMVSSMATVTCVSEQIVKIEPIIPDNSIKE